MNLHGKIVAGDSDEKTITIKCDDRISGVQIGGRVIITDEWPDPPKSQVDQQDVIQPQRG